MTEIPIEVSRIEDELELAITSDQDIPVEIQFPTDRSLPVFVALGCLGCIRLKREVDTYARPGLSMEVAMFTDDVYGPGVSRRLADGITVWCKLIEDANVHPEHRSLVPPCLDGSEKVITLLD